MTMVPVLWIPTFLANLLQNVIVSITAFELNVIVSLCVRVFLEL